MTSTYQPTWDSLTQHSVPQWFSDSKFGLYAHWGIYSVPGFGNEWYGKWMNDPSHEIHRRHVEKFGSPADYGYTKFIDGFTAEHYDPEEWAELFAASGARYAGFSLAHHDGFGLWDSDVYRWNAGKMGTEARSLWRAGDSAAQTRSAVGGALSTSSAASTGSLPAGINGIRPSTRRPSGADWRKAGSCSTRSLPISTGCSIQAKFEDFFEQWQLKVREVIDKYRPDMMWFDGGKFREDGYEETALEILAHYLNQAVGWGKEVLVLNKLPPSSMQYNFHPDFGAINFEKGRDRPLVYDRPLE